MALSGSGVTLNLAVDGLAIVLDGPGWHRLAVVGFDWTWLALALISS